MALKSISLLLLLLLFMGCTTDSTDDLTDPMPIDAIAYNEHIKSIINNNCVTCHGSVPSNGAPMSLVTYENVRDAVLERNLIGKISLENGDSGLMPLGGPRLPQTTIDLFIQWQADGFQQ